MLDRLAGERGIPKDSPAERRRLERPLEARRAAEESEGARAGPARLVLGRGNLSQELLAQMSEGMGAEDYGAERTERGADRAEGITME